MTTRSFLPKAVAAFGLFALAATASAQPIDSFEIGPNAAAGQYTVAPVPGQNPSIIGWTGAWQAGFQGTNLSIIESGLSFPGLPTAGGAIQPSESLNGRVGRDLSAPITNSTVRTQYFSFLFEADSAVNGAQITYGGFELHNPNSIEDGDRVFQLVVGENTNGSSQSPNFQAVLFNSDNPQFFGDLGANNDLTNLFVVKLELTDTDNGDVISVFRNPSLAAEPATPDFTATGFNLAVGSTSFAKFGAAGVFTFDELRLGNSYASVTQAVPDFLPGDSDGDFTVEFSDFFPIRDNWLDTNTSTVTLTRAQGDLDLSGAVDLRDFREWKDAFNPSPAQLQFAFSQLGAAVPEPAGLALGALCVAAACGGRRD